MSGATRDTLALTTSAPHVGTGTFLIIPVSPAILVSDVPIHPRKRLASLILEFRIALKLQNL